METESGIHIASECHKSTLGQQALAVAELIVEILFLILKTFYYVGEATYLKIFPIEKPVKGEIVLVTGAGHGIGRELALRYASLGATVIAWDINEKTNEETVKEIARRSYPKATGYTVDVTKSDQVRDMAKRVQKDVGDVTILVNNAGIMPCHFFTDHTNEQIQRIMDINLIAHCWTVKAFLPGMMKNNHGHIVTISSCAGLFGLRNLAPYCASKYAVRGLAEGLLEDLRHNPRANNIQVTVVFPYMVATGLCKKPHIRFSKFLPLLKSEEVARKIVEGQRRNAYEVVLPGFIFWLNNILRCFPIKVGMACADFLDTFVDSD